MTPPAQPATLLSHAALRTRARAGTGAALRLLLVEDSDTDAALFAALIRSIAFVPTPSLVRARSIVEAAAFIAAESPDCVLLDLGLPDAFGLSGLESLRAVDGRPAFLMLTGLDDDKMALAALSGGAQEYLVKDDADDKTLGRAILRSIQRHQLLAELANQTRNAQFNSTHDGLTGLANRRLLEERLARQCAQQANSSTKWGLVMLDLDGFKAINDSHGHTAGDEVLKVVSRRLRMAVRGDDLAARLGGDEFVLLVTDGLASSTEPEFIQRLRLAIEQPIQIGPKAHPLSSSVGIAYSPEDGIEAAQLLAAADRRMYADKQARHAR